MCTADLDVSNCRPWCIHHRAKQMRLAQQFAQAQEWMNLPGDPLRAWYEARNLITQTLKREIGVLHSLVDSAGGVSGADADAVKELTQDASDLYTALTVEARAKGIRAVAPTAPGVPMRRPIVSPSGSASLAR